MGIYIFLMDFFMREINKLSAREAMDLPDYYQACVLENYENYFERFRFKSCCDFLGIISSFTSTFPERFVAGTLLGLIGDPRLNLLNPNMINIPSAKIRIGSTFEEIEIVYHTYKDLGVKREWLLKEYPKHEINISEFRLAKFLVTNYEYLIFLKETKHTDLPTSWRFGIYDPAKANHPVYGILPESADDYALWLSKKTGRYFRLPTEYEWEYAAAGEGGSEFPWGQVFSSKFANTIESNICSTTPVGLYPEGAALFGCLDMAGNVEEYVSNNYFVYPDGEVIQDDLLSLNNYRIARGGSFTRHADLARCRRRHGFYKKEIYVIGFRLAETITER